MTVTTNHSGFRLLRSDTESRDCRTALTRLFAGNGTIYLVVGFFTYNGYRSIREEIVGFLEREPDNELYIVVGPATDQFSPRIAKDLWSLDTADRVHLRTHRRGLHAKLYLRDGPEPMVIHTSTNLTQVGFTYNLELGVERRAEDRTDPQIAPFIAWAEELVARSDQMRPRDLRWIVQLWNSIANWSNKARLLPRRHIAKRIAPFLVLLVVVAVVAGIL